MGNKCSGCSFWYKSVHESWEYCHYMAVTGVSRAKDENKNCLCYTTKNIEIYKERRDKLMYENRKKISRHRQDLISENKPWDDNFEEE